MKKKITSEKKLLSGSKLLTIPSLETFKASLQNRLRCFTKGINLLTQVLGINHSIYLKQCLILLDYKDYKFQTKC